MSNLVLLAARRKQAQLESLGLEEQAKRARKRVKELEEAEALQEAGVSMSNTKDELLAAASAAGVDVDESMTKAEILEALEA